MIFAARGDFLFLVIFFSGQFIFLPCHIKIWFKVLLVLSFRQPQQQYQQKHQVNLTDWASNHKRTDMEPINYICERIQLNIGPHVKCSKLKPNV